MEDVQGDRALAEELRQRQQQDDVQVVQPSNIAATFDLDAAEAPLQALFTNVRLFASLPVLCPLMLVTFHQQLTLKTQGQIEEVYNQGQHCIINQSLDHAASIFSTQFCMSAPCGLNCKTSQKLQQQSLLIC